MVEHSNYPRHRWSSLRCPAYKQRLPRALLDHERPQERDAQSRVERQYGVPVLQRVGAGNSLVVQRVAHVRPRTLLSPGCQLELCRSYYSAGTSETFDNQHLHVLEGSSTDIWNSTWSYKSRVTIPNRGVWSIDGTVCLHLAPRRR